MTLEAGKDQGRGDGAGTSSGPGGTRDSPVCCTPSLLLHGTATFQTSILLKPKKYPLAITPGGAALPSTSPIPKRLSTTGRPRGGTGGTPLTFLRLEEAVLPQLGQQRTAGTGGLEVAQGNVGRVEPVRQMGEACRKTGTEEGNMFQPRRLGTSPAGAQTVGAGGPSRASSGGCEDVHSRQGTAHDGGHCSGPPPFWLPVWGSPSSPLAQQHL